MSAENNATVDRRVNRAWVASLLKRALVEAVEMGRIPGTSDDPIDAFGGYLQRLRPVVLVESAIAYAEHLIADVMIEQGCVTGATTIVDLLKGEVDLALPRGDDTLILLSFYEDAAFANPIDVRSRLERTSHAVLIGCQRAQDLPDTFRRLIDLTLRLPEGSPADYRALFEALFDVQPPAKAPADANWQRWVLPTDLQQPLRLGYTGDEAAAYVEGRVRQRQREAASQDATLLSQLHGLGEARGIAEDLIADLQAALRGGIPWSEVDCGMLMVGPPGTGKTSLARAIARECEVSFIATSPARWQGADLGAHLANIRSTFEEARRADAAIVFIDEIDGLGNREQMESVSRSYQGKVINAVLEELDGFHGRHTLVVIAATNDETRVDPALRRAGRLDQVVRIPYPNIAALVEIYRHHLAPHAARGRLDSSLDLPALAGLTFGLTGSDVEYFVRGAARRARRRRDVIRQQDLLDEIMRRPRQRGQRERIGVAARERLAVHEAGHALASFLGPLRGTDIGYVSIAPRSDGRIGYTARLPDERVSMTREDMLHEIRVCLAGRAAEEVRYGAAGVSDLAAEHGSASDLAVATSRARQLLGTSGLMPQSGLLWWGALPEPLRAGLSRSVEEVLREAYASACTLLRQQRSGLDRIAGALVRTEELDQAAIRRLLEGGAATCGTD